MNINERLKLLRQSKNLTQNEAANLLNVSLSSYQKYERDKNNITPSLEVLIKLVDFYHVTTDYLLGRETNEIENIDRLANEFNMTVLEKKILDNYLSLPKQMRIDLMEFLHKSVQEVQQESNKI